MTLCYLVSTGLQEFLQKCEAQLGQQFYTSCSFPTAYQYQSLLNEKVIQNVEKLNSAAREIISIKKSDLGMLK